MIFISIYNTDMNLLEKITKGRKLIKNYQIKIDNLKEQQTAIKSVLLSEGYILDLLTDLFFGKKIKADIASLKNNPIYIKNTKEIKVLANKLAGQLKVVTAMEKAYEKKYGRSVYEPIPQNKYKKVTNTKSNTKFNYKSKPL